MARKVMATWSAAVLCWEHHLEKHAAYAGTLRAQQASRAQRADATRTVVNVPVSPLSLCTAGCELLMRPLFKYLQRLMHAPNCHAVGTH